ncbi:hypothetical protein [Nocardioides ferulae]|uniref:hypothetical protein n=1 Tax=Nocardioides ferulae TaxID=2340821 RepID=UPI001F0CB7D6|nr:hypothetical protein [Nocardioides ferulae]
MAASGDLAATSVPTSRNGRVRTRRAPDPARRRLALAVGMVVLGSFLPWIYTSLGSLSGVRGGGLWTFYFAMLGLAGALIPSRRAAAVQAGLMAAPALVLPVWQVLHVAGLVGFSGWLPGPGLLMVFAGGVVAAGAARALWRGAVAPA